MKRRRSRHASLSGGEGTVCVPMIAGLTEQQVQGLREVFSLFDPEGSGRVRPEEIRSAATSSGLEKEFPEVWQFMTALDGHDSVDFQEIQLGESGFSCAVRYQGKMGILEIH
ncbi:unnamed protein product [Cladocopium goreaui]|uniref:Caltractin ICL1e (Centrin-5) n=1 Tax=Cladocopium goreaui TaxID=2562237 RepID=A0A9P1G542_9DINO|nr:unnamed protein product [Cladocopium goreaui]